MTLTAEWVEKAEEDWRVAQSESRLSKAPAYNAICFHAQQCIEKYLKACLHNGEKYFDKTHNLVKLLDQLLVLEAALSSFRKRLQELTTHAVEIRCPGLSADRVMARTSMTTSSSFRKATRKH